jgi:hypothetical protein
MYLLGVTRKKQRSNWFMITVTLIKTRTQPGRIWRIFYDSRFPPPPAMVLQPISCLGLLVFEVTGSHSDTWKTGRSPLNGLSNLCRSHYLHNTQQSQPKNIRTFSKIRTRNSSNRTVADLRLRSHAHWDRRISRIRISLLFASTAGSNVWPSTAPQTPLVTLK